MRLRDDSLPFARFAIAVQGPGNKSNDRLPLLIATSALGSYNRNDGNHGPQGKKTSKKFKMNLSLFIVVLNLQKFVKATKHSI